MGGWLGLGDWFGYWGWVLGFGVGGWLGQLDLGGGGVQLKFEHGDVTDGGAGEQEELGTTGFGHRVVVEGEQGWVEGG